MWKPNIYDPDGYDMMEGDMYLGGYWPDADGWRKPNLPDRKLWYWSHVGTGTAGFAYTEDRARKIMETLEGKCVVA
jgi:hypothetical protein